MSHSKAALRKRKAREQRKKLDRRLGFADPIGDEISLMRRMSTHHLDILQNIEYALLTIFKVDPALDDRAIAVALGAYLDNESVIDEDTRDILGSINMVRATNQGDHPESRWRDGMKVVLDSVKTHSTLAPGDRGYLRFISRFIP